MKTKSIFTIVLFFGLAQFSFSQTTCFEADNNYVYTGGSSARSIAKGDFNNDGKLDIIMGNSTGTSSDPTLQRLTYIQSDGTGGFLAPVNFMSGSRVFDVATGDIDGDGKLDAIVVNFNMNRVAIIRGNGNGTFQTPIGYATSFGPISVEIADINGDGKLDVIVVGTGGFVDVFLNDGLGLGNLLPKISTSLPASAASVSFTIADFNSDGLLDIATADNGTGSTSVLFGNGLGSFAFSATYPTGLGANDIVADDFNGDGKIDLAVVNQDANTVSVLLNNGAGTFAAAVNYPVGLEPISIETGDFNGDGIRDLSIVNTIGNSMSTLRGVANGTFLPHVEVYAMNAPRDLVVGDFNNDGFDDVIHSCLVGAVMPVYYGYGDGEFRLGNMVQVGNSPRDIATGNFSNNGFKDFAAINYNDNTVSIHNNDGIGNYTFGYNLTTGANPSSIVSGDFNGNGFDDLIVTNYNDGTASIYFNTAGIFSAPVTISVNAKPIKIRKGDFNNDGVLDLFIVNEADQVTILPGVAGGTFSSPIIITTGSLPRDIAIGKIDADVYDDFVISLNGSNQVVVYKSDGVSGFVSAPALSLGAGAKPIGIALADLTNDGRPEIIVANNGTNNFTRFTNNGVGLFNAILSATYSSSDTGPTDITAGDFNGDGNIDIAITYLVSVASVGNVVLYAGNGTGLLTLDKRHSVGMNPVAILTDDLDNNGSLDLAVVNEKSNYVSIMRSSSSVPVISAGGPTTICGSGSVTLTSTPAGEYLWSNGATTQSITVSLAGTYSVTTSAPGGGCTEVSNSITVNNLPSPNLTFTGSTNICAGGSTTITVSGATSYQWSDGLGVATTQTLNPATSKTYKVVGLTAGCTDTLSIPIVVNPLPNAGFNNLAASYCQAGGTVPLTPNTAGGTFSGPGVSGNIFDPLLAGVGTKVITYSITDGNSCSNSSTQSVVVTAGGVDATFTTLSSSYCKEDGAITLVPATPGGTFSATGPGLSGNVFTPSSANVGSVDITYSITSGGCSGTSTQTVLINAMPNANFAGFNPNYCANEPVVALAPVQSGGTFSGPGIVGSNFNPTTAGAGSHSITYSITVNGCTSTKSETIVVKPLPNATFSGLSSKYCLGAGSVTLSAVETGGTFTGAGITGNVFNPTTAGANTHIITYTVNGVNGCTSVSTQTVTVNPLPVATFTGLATNYCVSAGSVTLTAGQTGGTFSGPGITGTSFSPATAGNGTHTITYTITDANSCSATTTQTVTVNPLPSAIFTGLAPSYCMGAGNATLTAVEAGGTFSGPGITGSVFNPNAAGAGTHTISYSYTNGNGCSASTTQSVTVNPLPVATFTGLDSKYCIDAPAVTLTATQSGGTFSGPGITGTSFNPATAGNGTHTITYSITDANSCSATTTQTVTVSNVYPVATFTGLVGPYCVNAAAITMTPTTTGGTFSGVGVSGNTFDPSIAGVGTHPITYTVSNTNMCEAQTTINVQVTAVPVATFTGLAAKYCVDASAVTMTATQSGGTFSGPGVTGVSFNPATAGPGNHTITYSITLNGCTSTTTQTVTVNPLPVATFTGLSANYCVNAGVVTLTAGQTGGTFSGPGITGTSFNPATAGNGTHSITYTITDANSCSATTTQTVTVNPLPNATFSGLAATYCMGAGNTTLTPVQSGGTFSGPGITGSVFNPNTAGAGTHTISYSYTDGNGCIATTTQSVTVNPLPSAIFTGLDSEYCIDASAVTLTATQSGGTFSGPGITGTSFNPATAGNGTHTITYSITDANSCSATTTQTVTVDNVYPVATFTGLVGPYCVNASAITMTPTTTGGTFSGVGVSGNTFDPSIAGVGTHPITYTVSGTNMCEAQTTINVQVTAVPVATFTGLAAKYCVDASAVTMTATQSGGTFSGPGVTGVSFNPATAGPGNHTITYSITLNGCTSTTTQTLTVNPLPVATFTGLSANYCVNAGVVTLTAGQTGGTFSGPGITGTSFNPATAGNGTHTITYTITDANSCYATTTQTVIVDPLPNATFSGLASTYCMGAGNATLTAVEAGGTFSGPGITGTVFNPNTAGAGAHTISYSYTDGNGCTATTTQSVTVNPLPSAIFTGLDSEYCIDASAVTLTAAQGGGTFSGPGITGTSFNPATAGNGTHTITYTITDANSCSATTTQTVTVDNVYPVVTFTGLASSYCADASIVTLTPTTTGGTFSGAGVTGNTFDPSIAGVGTHLISYSITGANTCAATETISVEVYPLPVATFSGLDPSYCISVGAVTLTPTQTGGTFSGPGISGNTFDPVTAGLGTHTITYLITENGCTTSSNKTVTVNSLPNASFTGLLTAYCVDEPVVTLTPVQSGGTFSGPGITGTSFNAANAGAGNHTIEYTFTDGNGCSATSAQTVIVNPLPVATFTGLASSYCIDASSVTLIPTSPGGTFSGSGITGSTFNPNAAGTGIHTITYTPLALNGCTNSSSQTVLVTPLSNASFGGLAVKYCIDAGVATLTASQTGGTFSGPGVSGNTFDPSIAGVGSHIITYSLTDGNGCFSTSSQPTTVSNVYPDASLSNLAASYCIDAAVVTIIPNVPGGIITGPGITGNTFDPSVAGVGNHVITYTITGPTLCTSIETVNVEVTALPLATFTGLNANYCVNETFTTLTATVGGGTFSGPGISGNTFDPALAGVGTHSIVYSITDGGGCSATSTEIVVVNSLPDATFTGLDPEYCVNETPVLLTGVELGGSFSGSGIGGDYFDPGIAGVGTFLIQYEYTDGNGCTATSTQSVIVKPLPDASFSGLDPEYCVDASAVTLTVVESGGTFSGAGMSGYSFDPAIAGEGTFIIEYEFTGLNGCTSSTTQSVTVNPLPVATFNGLEAVYCANNDLVLLSPNLVGGTFSGVGVSGDTFDAGVAGIGFHDVTYTVTDGNGCTNSSTSTVEVIADIIVTFTGPVGVYCSADQAVIDLVPNIPGGTFTGPGVTGNTWSPNDANLGNNTILYEVSDGVCSNTFTMNVGVLLSPNANFTNMQNVYCQNEDLVTLVPNQAGGVFTATSGLSSDKFYPQIATLGTNSITYSISSPNGCSNSKTQTFEVVSGPVSTITVNDTILIADVTGPSISYQWINCGDQTPIVGENDSVLHVGTYGVYSLAIFDGVCRDTSSCVVIYFADVETYLDEKGVKLYPNPNNGQFKIETTFDAKIEIINAIGQMVYRNEHVKGQSEINLGSAIETGMYIVKFTNDNGVSVYRNVVVRN